MPNHKAAGKSLKTDAAKRTRNRAVKSRIWTLTKKVTALSKSGNKDEAEANLREAVSVIDTAAKNHQIHRNSAARKKSRLMKLVQGIS